MQHRIPHSAARRLMVIVGLLLATIYDWALAQPPTTWTPSKLAAAHQAMLDSMRTCHIICESDVSEPSPYGDKIDVRHEWWKDRHRERRLLEWTVKATSGKIVSRQEVAIDRQTNRMTVLHIQDTKRLEAKLAPGELRKNVRASDRPLVSGEQIPVGTLVARLFVVFSYDMSSELSLGEVVRRFRDVKIAGIERVGDDNCIHLSCAFPGKTLGGADVGKWDLYFAMNRGLWVRRAVKTLHYPATQHSAQRDVRVEVDLDEFQNCGNGIWVPLRVTSRTFSGGKVVATNHLRLSSVKINHDLKPDAASITWPSRTLITRFSAPVANQTKRHPDLLLTDDDGKIVRTLRPGTAEYEQFLNEDDQSGTTPGFDGRKDPVPAEPDRHGSRRNGRRLIRRIGIALVGMSLLSYGFSVVSRRGKKECPND